MNAVRVDSCAAASRSGDVSVEWACRLPLIAVSALVLALAGGGSSAAGAEPRASAAAAPVVGCPELKPSRLRSPQRFVAGLSGAWVPEEARNCLYMIPSRMSQPVPVYRITLGQRLRGPVWSPTRPQLAVAHCRGRGFEVALLDTNGQMLRRFIGRDAAFFRDGRMLLRQGDQLWLVGEGKRRRLVGRDQLQRAAGFPITALSPMAGITASRPRSRCGNKATIW